MHATAARCRYRSLRISSDYGPVHLYYRRFYGSFCSAAADLVMVYRQYHIRYYCAVLGILLDSGTHMVKLLLWEYLLINLNLVHSLIDL